MKNALKLFFISLIFCGQAKATCPFITSDQSISGIANRLQSIYQGIDDKNRACRSSIQGAIDSIRSTQEISDAAFAAQEADVYQIQNLNRQILAAGDDTTALDALVEQRSKLETDRRTRMRPMMDQRIMSSRKDAYNALMALSSIPGSNACAGAGNATVGVLDAGLGLMSLASPALASGDLSVRAGGMLLRNMFNMLDRMSSSSSEKLNDFQTMNTYLCIYNEMLQIQCKLEGQKLSSQPKALSGLTRLSSTFKPEELAIFKNAAISQNQLQSVSRSLVDLSLGHVTGGASTVDGIFQELSSIQNGNRNQQDSDLVLEQSFIYVDRAYNVIPTSGPERTTAIETFNETAVEEIRTIARRRPALGKDLGITSETGQYRNDFDAMTIWKDPAKRQAIMSAVKEIADASRAKKTRTGNGDSVESVSITIRQDQERARSMLAMEKSLAELIKEPSSDVSPAIRETLERHRASLKRIQATVHAANQCISDPLENATVCSSIPLSLKISGTVTATVAEQAVEREVSQHITSLQTQLLNKSGEISEDPFAIDLEKPTGSTGYEKYLAVARSIESVRSTLDPDEADIQDVRILRNSFEQNNALLDTIARGASSARSEPERLKQICAMMKYSLRDPAGNNPLVNSCRGVPLPSRFGGRTGSCAYQTYLTEELTKDQACTGQAHRFPIEPMPSCDGKAPLHQAVKNKASK